MKTNKAIIYTRVSSKQQRKEGYSIPMQIKICEQYAFEHNLEVFQVYEEVESAKSKGRIKFGEAIDLLENGKASHIIVEKDDRLTRNHVDKIKLDELIDLKGISLHFVRANKVIDRNSSPEDRFMLNIHTSVNQYYIDDLRQKIKKGQRGSIESGIWAHRPKMGYYRDKESKLIFPDETQAPIIKRMFQDASTGMYTLKQLREQAIRSGLRTGKGKKPSLEYIRQALKEPFYYGWLRWGLNKETGEYNIEAPGLHEPLISKELFDKVQRAMRKKPQVSQKGQFPYKPILKCEICGCPITAEIKKKKIKATGETKLYILYHCTNSKGQHYKVKSINQNKLEDLFFSYIEDIELPVSIADRLAKKLNERKSESIVVRKKLVGNLKRKLAKLKQEKQGLIRMRAMNELDQEEYSVSKSQIDSEIHEIELKIREYESNPNMNDETALAMIELFKSIKTIYLNETPDRRAKLLNILASNWLFDGVSLSPEWRYPFGEFIEADTFQQKWS